MGLLTTLLLVALPLLAAGALNTPGVQGSQSAIYLPLVMAPPYYRPVTASPQRALHRDRSRHPHRSECRRLPRPAGPGRPQHQRGDLVLGTTTSSSSLPTNARKAKA